MNPRKPPPMREVWSGPPRAAFWTAAALCFAAVLLLAWGAIRALAT